MAMPARRLNPTAPTDPDLRSRLAQWLADRSAEDLRWAAEQLAAASEVLARGAGPDPGARRDAIAQLGEHGPESPRPLGLFANLAAVEAAAADLGAREAEVAAHARSLAEREQRLEQARRELVASQRTPAPPQAWAVPAAAAAAQLHALRVDTGDDVATLAQGVGVEAEWAAGVLSGEITTVDIAHVQALCEGLHCTPYDLFGAEAARSIDHAYGPELWPRYIEPLEPAGPLAPTLAIESLEVAEGGEGSRATVSVAAVVAELRARLARGEGDLGALASEVDLSEDWIRAVLRGEVESLSSAEVDRLALALDKSPESLGDDLGPATELELPEGPELGPQL